MSNATNTSPRNDAIFNNVVLMTNVPQKSTSLKMWLRSDAGVNYTYSTAGYAVSQWTDQSGNVHHATQTNASKQPTFIPALSSFGTGGQNGLPAVNLNGSQFLSLASSSLLSDFTAGSTVFIVTKPASVSSGNYRMLWLGQSGTVNNQIGIDQTSSTQWIHFVYNAGTASFVTASGLSTSGYQVLESVYNGSNTDTLYSNSTQVASSTSMQTAQVVNRMGTIGAYNNGSSLFYTGAISEILVYSSSLTTQQRQSVESYLYSKYFITGSGPPLSPAPTISPAGYSVSGTPVTVTMSTTLPSPAQIIYTTDGSTPSPTNGTFYSQPITISSTTTVQAVVWQPSYSASAVTTSNIQIDPFASYVTNTGLLCWYKADYGVTNSGSPNFKVSKWADVSGNGLDAIQNTSGNQPTFPSGSPANVNFASASSQWMAPPTGFSDFTAGASIFIVANPTSPPANACLFNVSNGYPNNNVAVTMPTNSTFGFYSINGSSSSNLNTSSSSVSAGVYQLLESVHNGAGSANVYVNGTLKGEGTVFNINDINRGSNSLGALFGVGNYFDGHIAEILIYNRAVSSAERINIEKYANAKYLGILNPPTITPGTGLYSFAQRVTMVSDPGTQIWYTVDGSTPGHATGTSVLYAGPISFSSAVTVKAIAYNTTTSTTSAVTTAVLSFDTTLGAIPTSGLQLWLRSDLGITSGGGSPNLVSNWADQSGKGNDASQSTTGNKPALLANAINGLPAVTTNVSGHSASYFNLPAGFDNFTAGATLFLVVSPGSAGPMLDLGNGSTSDNFTFGNSSTATTETLTLLHGATSSSLSQTGALTTNQFQLLAATYNGSNTATIYVNGVQQNTGSSMQTLNVLLRALNHLGANYNASASFSGSYGELLLYNRQLTSGELSAVTAYLTQRYQLSTVPVTAPTFSPGASSTLTAPIQVSIAAQPGAKIYVTTDGSAPSASSSQLYTGPVSIPYGLTLRAISVVNGITSGGTSATYSFASPIQWPAPNASDPTPLQLHLQLPTNAF